MFSHNNHSSHWGRFFSYRLSEITVITTHFQLFINRKCISPLHLEEGELNHFVNTIRQRRNPVLFLSKISSLDREVTFDSLYHPSRKTDIIIRGLGFMIHGTSQSYQPPVLRIFQFSQLTLSICSEKQRLSRTA